MTRRFFLLLGACLPAVAEPDQPKLLSADELKALLAKEGKRLFILDVREAQELEAEGALAGAHNIPMQQIETRLREIPTNRPLLIYCSQGIRAEWAADKLRRRGYTIRGIGALSEWKARKHPVVFPSGAKR
mgnify:CR=1 FL=1